MASLKKQLFFLIFVNSGFAQTQDYVQTISFTFSRSLYQQRSEDSIKALYLAQERFLNMGDAVKVNPRAIARKFPLSELEVMSIPAFRLKWAASREFDCGSSIEKYIAFEEKYKFLYAYVAVKGRLIGSAIVPNPVLELERTSNPDDFLYVSSEDFIRYYIDKFSINENLPFQEAIGSRNLGKSFYFFIYGLYDVLFEIGEDVRLYANFYEPDKAGVKRIFANEYIRSKIGESAIRELSRGYYMDFYDTGTLDHVPCKATSVVNPEKISIKPIIRN